MTTTRCAGNQAPDLNDNTVEKNKKNKKNKKSEYKPQKPRKRKAKTGSPRPPASTNRRKMLRNDEQIRRVGSRRRREV